MRFFFLLVLGGCATIYPECENYEGVEFEKCQEIAREYDRVNYIESVFKPMLRSCIDQGGYSQWSYRGVPSHNLRQAVKTGNYDKLTKMETKGWGCCLGPGLCGLL